MCLFGKLHIQLPVTQLPQSHTLTTTEVFQEPLSSQGQEGPDLLFRQSFAPDLQGTGQSHRGRAHAWKDTRVAEPLQCPGACLDQHWPCQPMHGPAPSAAHQPHVLSLVSPGLGAGPGTQEKLKECSLGAGWVRLVLSE